MPASQVGGGLGIRTLGALRHTTFRESHLRPLGQPSKLYLHPIRFGKWGELMGRTQRFFRFRTLENLHKSRLFRVERSTKRFRFRVLHLRPLGQLSICQSENHFQNFWKELTERTPILFSFRTVKPRINTGFLADKTYTASKNFESAPL